MDMCIRCGKVEVPGPLGLCPTCVVQARVELTEGMRRMRDYLAKWAAFEEWDSDRRRGPGPSEAV